MDRLTTAPAVIESIIDDWRTILDYEYQADRFEDGDLRNLSRLFDEVPKLVSLANQTADALQKVERCRALLNRVANPNLFDDPTPRGLAEVRNCARAVLAELGESC